MGARHTLWAVETHDGVIVCQPNAAQDIASLGLEKTPTWVMWSSRDRAATSSSLRTAACKGARAKLVWGISRIVLVSLADQHMIHKGYVM